MSRPRVLLDIDGVCADFPQPVLDEVNRLLGTAYTAEDLHEYDMMKALGAPPEVARAVDALIARPGFCRSLALYPGAREGVAALRELADVHAVTSPYNDLIAPHWMPERAQWLREELGFDREHIHHSSGKYICSGELLIEDKPSTLVTWEDEHTYFTNDGKTHGRGVLFERPWNRADDWCGLRVSSWPNLVALVSQYLGDLS